MPSMLKELYCMVSQPKPAPPSVPTPSRARIMDILFSNFNEDEDGKISPSKLRNCMRASGEELSPADTEEMVRYSDFEGDGLLCSDDIAQLVGGDEEEMDRSLRAEFRAYEMEGRWCITVKSLKRALGRLEETKSVTECREMIRRFDIDGDGVLSFKEFRIMMAL